MKIYCFDFDGTIADTVPLITKTLNSMFKGEVSEERIKEEGLKKIIREMKISPIKLFFLVRKARTEMNKEIKKMKPIEGMKEVLEELEKRGHTLGILTSNSKRNVVDFLKESDLPLFDFIVTSSILGKEKKIRKTKRRGDLVYIGDETRDVEAGRGAGVYTIAVTWGLNSEKQLLSVNPDMIARKPEEILDFKFN